MIGVDDPRRAFEADSLGAANEITVVVPPKRGRDCRRSFENVSALRMPAAEDLLDMGMAVDAAGPATSLSACIDLVRARAQVRARTARNGLAFDRHIGRKENTAEDGSQPYRRAGRDIVKVLVDINWSPLGPMAGSCSRPSR